MSQGRSLEDEVKIKKFKPASISFTIGGYEDHYLDLTMEGLQSMIGSQDNLSSYLGAEYQADYFTAIMGSNLGIYFSLNPYSKKKGRINTNHELRFGLSTNIGREAVLVYTSDVVNQNIGYQNYDEVVFCLIENEVMIESSYLFHWTPGKRFSLYGGGGLNLGATHNNELLIFGSGVELDPTGENTPSHEVLGSSYVRIIFQGGMKYRMIGGFGMSLEMQGGNGWQFVHGGSNNAFENCATSLGFFYDFGK